MRIFFHILFSLCAANITWGQFGNEWVSYGANFWKFPIVNEGIYRLGPQELVQAGVDLNNWEPSSLQLIANGQTIFWEFIGDDDGLFEPDEYYFAFLQANSSRTEWGSYANEAWHPNSGHSLFNDTLYHYITKVPSAELTSTVAIPLDVNVPIHEALIDQVIHGLHSNYYTGRADNNGISLPSYDEGEGWFDPSFGNNNYQVNIALPARHIGFDQVMMNWRVASVNSALGIPNHHLQVELPQAGGVVYDTTFTGYKLLRKSAAVGLSEQQNAVVMNFRTVNDLGVSSDRMAVGQVEATYMRMPQFNQGQMEVFELEAIPGAPWTKMELSLSGYTWPQLYILQDGIKARLPIINTNGTVTVFIPWNGESRQTLLLVDGGTNASIQDLRPVVFVDYMAEAQDDQLVILTHRSLWNAAQNYAAFKELNGHSVLLVDVEQLYHQFGLGVMNSPLAIRRFFGYLFSQGVEPGHLFLLGKSIHEATVGTSTGSRNSPLLYARNLVPTWGYPGSDVMLTAGLNGALYEAAIPTGRLSAESPEEVLDYLNKVVEHSTQPAAMWKKNILHFGGGSIAYEQELFRNYLNTYKGIAQGESIGADVHSFFKNTSEPIQLDVSDSIQYFINEGVSVMTFFGHASSTGFDQNIDAPENYSNQGKYPLLIGNSCYTGNIHLATTESASELFVKAPNRGVIGFLAKSDLGIPTYLDIYTQNFYLHLFQFHYGSTIGQCMKFAVQAFQSENDFYKQNVAQNFALHGDPSIVLFPHDKPDFVVDDNSIIVPSTSVSTGQADVEIRTVVENWGKVELGQVEVQLLHRFPDGTDTTYVAYLDQSYRVDTLIWQIAHNRELGQHLLRLTVDYPGNAIDELENVENNATGFVPFQVTDGDIRPVYPYDFAVIDEANPVLKASTAYALEQTRTYRLQADTSAAFDSPVMVETTRTSPGGIVEWNLPLVLEDSTVVFWRCSPDSLQLNDQWYWKGASFQYISNRRGWGQQHSDQFRQNALQGLTMDASSFEYETATAQLKCEVYGSADSFFENLATRYQLNLDVQEYGGFGYNSPALMVAVLDSSSLLPWLSNYAGMAPEHDFGNTLASANARARQEKYFIFQQDDNAQLEGLANMLNTGVEAGQHVLMYTWQYALPSVWPSNLVDALNNRGLTQWTALTDSLPFIGYWKQGDESSIQTVQGVESSSVLQLIVSLEGQEGQGRMTSPTIGPATSWGEAEWLFGPNNLESSDGLTWSLSAGISNPTGTYLNDIDNWTQPAFPMGILNNSDLPMARWQFDFTDPNAGTLPPLQRIHLWYAEAPEFAIAANAQSYFAADTVAQGQDYRFMVPVRNVGHVLGDSLLVKYVIIDEKGEVHKLPYALQAPLQVGFEIRDTLTVSTIELSGWNRLIMIVNPMDSVTQRQHQLEEHDFNNFLERRFYVERDIVPPILEVSADGRHILDGEIISAKPDLLISLRDENRYLLFDDWSDTTHFRIYLTFPNGELSTVRFDQSNVGIQFSDGPGRPFSINYRPDRLADGLYVLRVQANDKSGNASGELDYRIHFRVVNEMSITEMMNYPNPFSTSTRFVFTLTGSEVPEDIKIQILSMSGKVVREIMGYELGELHVGRNITDYAWDGRDEFGDLLANGVYVYRTIIRSRGEEVKHLESGADDYFNRGFGKMYILR